MVNLRKRQRMQSIPMIQTDRLILKEMTPNDCPGVLEIFSDPLVVEFYDIQPITDQAGALRLIEGFAAWFKLGQAIRWGVWHAETDQLIGTCCFDQIHPRFRRVNLGYNLASDFWGQGYASEACRAIIELAFKNGLATEVNRIQAITVPENVKSEMVLHRLGFQCECLLREYGYWEGLPRDMNMFCLTKSDWKSKSKFENADPRKR